MPKIVEVSLSISKVAFDLYLGVVRKQEISTNENLVLT
jgi:hypothetical protein